MCRCCCRRLGTRLIAGAEGWVVDRICDGCVSGKREMEGKEACVCMGWSMESIVA